MADAPINPDEKKSPPRAFAQGTGWLLQTVGMILFFSSCLLCAFTPMWDKPLDSPIEIDRTIRENPPVGYSIRGSLSSPAKAGYTFTVATSTLGGLALAVLGLGLQADRRRSALGAVIAASTVEAILLVCNIALWIGGAPFGAILLNFFLLAVYGILLAFTLAAHRQVRASPPPEDIDIIPPGTKIPYSFYHDDPPEVRLARDLEARRKKLNAEQSELDRLQRELDEKQKKKD